MPEMVIRPTMKFITAGYAVVIVLLVVVAGITVARDLHLWVPFASSLLLVWPLKYHLRALFTKISIIDDKLRHETGFLGKTTRSILISRIQNITVRQSAGQRIFRVGDLSIETAGETSSLTIKNIDNPQKVADHIHALSEKGPAGIEASSKAGSIQPSPKPYPR